MTEFHSTGFPRYYVPEKSQTANNKTGIFGLNQANLDKEIAVFPR